MKGNIMNDIHKFNSQACQLMIVFGIDNKVTLVYVCANIDDRKFN